MSEARPALWTDNRETSGYVVETDCARPPNRHNRFSGKTLNRPLGFHVPAFTAFLRFPGSSACHVSQAAGA